MGSRTEVGATWGWGAIGALACASVAVLEPSVLEEGLPLHVAQRLVQGERLYRDVMFFTGPLPFELLALLFRIFGDHLFVARGAVVVLQGLATAAVFDVAHRAGTGPFAHAAAAAQAVTPILLFPMFSIYFPSTLAALLATLAVWAAVRGTASLRWAFVAGLLTAGVALCKQTTGAALALVLLAGVAAYARPGRRLASAGAVAAGGVAAAVATLAAFAWHGTAGDLFASLVTMPLAMHESYNTPLPSFWPPGELGSDAWRNWPYYLPRVFVLLWSENPGKDAVRAMGVPTQLLYAAPFFAIALTAARALAGGLPAAAALPVSAVVAATLGLFPRSDWGHLSMALPATWVQLVLVATAWPTARVRMPRLRRIAAAAFSGALGAAAALIALAYHALAAPEPWDARVPVRPVSESYRSDSMPRVIEYLRSHAQPGEALFVARQEPLLYFVTGLRNPTRYEGMMQGLREIQEAEVIEALSRLRYVVMSEIDGPATGFYARELPAVAAYLERHFRIPADFALDREQWLVVYERAVDRGAPAIDLWAAADSARYWVKDPSGRLETFPTQELPEVGIRHLRRPLPVPVSPHGGGADFELVVPDGARLEVDLGIFAVNTTRGPFTPRWGATYRISVLENRSAHRLAETSIPDDPRGKATWQLLAADLSRWAGRRVVLRLEVVPEKPRKRVLLGFWGSPRIVSVAQAEDGAPPAAVSQAPAAARATP
ncbi:MAG TPA: hypothetical protein VHQ66_02195 [Myxococcota bacterium]|nr:hypothetical protein [Myxococcota bacterium]